MARMVQSAELNSGIGVPISDNVLPVILESDCLDGDIFTLFMRGICFGPSAFILALPKCQDDSMFKPKNLGLAHIDPFM